MSTEIYERLARHLDDLPPGFPRTEGGSEMRILRRLFSPEDAQLAIHLTLIAEESRVIARRARIPVEEASRRLEEMVVKGLIFSRHQENKPPLYMASPFAVGFWEAQVNRLDEELIQDAEEYASTYLEYSFWHGLPQLRTIPVGKSITVKTEVMPYERAEALVRTQKVFAVGNCICRQQKRLLGEGCDRPEESCLSFGMAAEAIVRSGRGRAISREEALVVLDKAQEVGLVLQPANARDALFICTCCGCCCGVLRSLKLTPAPVSLVASPFIAHLNVDTCTGCGICINRCQMDAVSLTDGKAALDLNRCIGCGLCVSACPTDSIALVRKPKAKQPRVPRDIIDTYMQLGKARGKLGIGKLIRMQVRSKLDRLLARGR